MALSAEYDVPTWNQIYSMLVRQAGRLNECAFKPDLIVGICRGGWIPARVLSDLLGNPNLANVRVESYIGIGKTKEPTLTQGVSAEVKGKKVLAVDEVADSGKSLKLVISHLRDRGAFEIKIATLYFKPQSVVKPDFYEKETKNWIIFPWDTKEVLQEIYRTHKNDAGALQKEAKKLSAAGVPKKLICLFLKAPNEASSC